MNAEERIEILYFFDTLCGWCYGFSPVISQLHEKHKDEWIFRVFSGGMMMGDRAGKIDDVAPYIKTAYRDVEMRTGIKFGDKFLNERLEPGEMILSSLEPAIVLAVFKTFETGKDILMAEAMQRAVYYDGVEPRDMEAMIPLAVELGVDQQEFSYRLSKPEYHDKAYDDFRTTQKFGIKGFPTTVLLFKDQYYLLGHGYTDLETLESRITNVINQESSTKS